MKLTTLFTVAAVGISLAMPLSAEGVKGRLGITGIAQAGIALGQQIVRSDGEIGTDFGGMLRYGVSKHLEIAAAYEDIGFKRDYRVEPITANLLYTFLPGKELTPVLQLGGGVSSNYPDKRSLVAPAGKAALGLEYYPCRYFAIGPQVNYTYVAQKGARARGHVHALGAGITASLFFGGAESAPAPAPSKVVETPKPVPPAPVPVSLSVSPAEVTLGPGQSQTFSAPVTGSDNQGVSWSLNPALGNLENGVYTAPATIALPETVTVTATSAADASKSASAVVKLTPPAAAPQQVSIELNVLFDSGKDVIKPEYDAEIRKVADFMKSYPSANAEIEGHTDNVGPAEMNMALSQRRADSVRNYLIQKLGVDGSRLTAKGYGPTKPIADNTTKEGRAKNRRVVATLTATKS